MQPPRLRRAASSLCATGRAGAVAYLKAQVSEMAADGAYRDHNAVRV
ncbi:hypothetical protein ACFXPY_17460 [Streptomyces sp. NPDC059153]